MNDQNCPHRKRLRLINYDYSHNGMYFITICTADRNSVLWTRPTIQESRDLPLSQAGLIVDAAINQIPTHYACVSIEKYCIMPDHLHMIINIQTDQCNAPTISTVIGSMKRWVSIQLGTSIWQKSFADRIIRNENEYLAIWEYIDKNPIKLDTAYDNID